MGVWIKGGGRRREGRQADKADTVDTLTYLHDRKLMIDQHCQASSWDDQELSPEGIVV